MEDMNVTKALLKAILELIEKCDTLEELRESVKKIMEEGKKKTSHRPKQLIFNTEPTASREPYPGRPLFYQSKARKTRG